jgi:hypothetical protein
MAGIIIRFFREFQFLLSIILVILGISGLLLGVAFFDFSYLKEMVIPGVEKEWMLYILILGFIVFVTGVWYLYKYLKNKKFIKDELKTNKRSELLKKHNELINIVRHMPTKYQKMLGKKEEELKIK